MSMYPSEKKLILDQSPSWSTIFYNDKIRGSTTLCPNQKCLPKTIFLNQESISMSNTKVDI
jgi:hypothetical protein